MYPHALRLFTCYCVQIGRPLNDSLVIRKPLAAPNPQYKTILFEVNCCISITTTLCVTVTLGIEIKYGPSYFHYVIAKVNNSYKKNVLCTMQIFLGFNVHLYKLYWELCWNIIITVKFHKI